MLPDRTALTSNGVSPNRPIPSEAASTSHEGSSICPNTTTASQNYSHFSEIPGAANVNLSALPHSLANLQHPTHQQQQIALHHQQLQPQAHLQQAPQPPQALPVQQLPRIDTGQSMAAGGEVTTASPTLSSPPSSSIPGVGANTSSLLPTTSNPIAPETSPRTSCPVSTPTYLAGSSSSSSCSGGKYVTDSSSPPTNLELQNPEQNWLASVLPCTSNNSNNNNNTSSNNTNNNNNNSSQNVPENASTSTPTNNPLCKF